MWSFVSQEKDVWEKHPLSVMVMMQWGEGGGADISKGCPGPGLQLHTAAHPGQLRRRFCLSSCYVGEAEAQRLNTLSKVTQLVRIRSEVWRLQKRGPWSLHRVPIWGSQACLLLPGETTPSPRSSAVRPESCSLLAAEPCAPLPTAHFWK